MAKGAGVLATQRIVHGRENIKTNVAVKLIFIDKIIDQR